MFGFYPSNTHAQILNIQVTIYYRCYERLAGMRPVASDARIASIKAGTLTGADACIQLLDEANLVAATNKVDTTKPAAVPILRKMFEVHRKFFTVKNFKTSFEDNNNPMLIDMYDPALYFSKILHSNLDISNLVAGTTYYKALRYNNSRGGTFPTGYFSLDYSYGVLTFSQLIGTAYTPSTLIQEGLLEGIADAASTVNDMVYANVYTNNKTDANFTSRNINHFAGGGVLGTQSFRLENGIHFGSYSDGGVYTQRRLGANVFKDLLCRDLPSLHADDADVVNNVVASSSLPFRTTNNCVRCHAGIDQMGNNFRNFIGITSSFDSNRYIFYAPHTNTNTGTNSRFPSTGDYGFYQKPPIGKLAFRSYDGSLVSVDTASVPDLGVKISNTNDFYVCMASKYYEYFTGIKANLSDSSASTIPAGEMDHRNAVINMGLALKSNQKLKELFRSIFNSDGFKYPGGN